MDETVRTAFGAPGMTAGDGAGPLSGTDRGGRNGRKADGGERTAGEREGRVPDGGALNGVEEIAQALERVAGDSGREAGPVEAPAAAGKRNAGEAGEAGGGREGGEIPGEAGEGEGNPPLPEGMDATLWERMSPEVRQAVHEREQRHAAALGEGQRQYAALRENREHFAIRANAAMRQALGTMRTVVEGEYAGTDWQHLARTDPAAYVRLQQGMQERLQAVQALERQVRSQVEAYEAQRTREENRLMQDEFATVVPEIRAMLGAGFDGRHFAAAVAGYMREQGCPPEVVNGLRKGYELRLVTKAMLFDRMQARRAAALKKVAEAPKVQRPQGDGTSGPEMTRMKRARARLERNPNSTDALAAVFEAM